MNKIKSFRLAIIWFLFILLLVSVPGTFIPSIQTFAEWLQWDKLTHFVLFGSFSFFLIIGFLKENHKTTWQIYCIAIFISILYGAFTEWWQKYVCINRDGNMFDFYADTIGAILGGVFYKILNKPIAKRVLSSPKN